MGVKIEKNHNILWFFGVRDWSRTNGVSLRRRTLYPTEVHGQI